MRSIPFLAATSLTLLVACPPEASGTDPFVDETGYLDAEQVVFTSEAPLTEARQVTLFGFEGAYDPPGGTLVVEGATGAAIVEGPDPTGAFRADFTAAAGDSVTLTYSPPEGEPETATLVLEDTLESLFAPAGGSATLVSDNGDGTVTVDFAQAIAGAPPFVAFVRGSGLSVLSETGEPVVLEAGPADEVCVFDIEPDAGLQSPFACETVF